MDDQRPVQIFEQTSKHAAGNLKKPCGKRSFAIITEVDELRQPETIKQR